MKIDSPGMMAFLKKPRNQVLLVAPVLGFMALHFALGKMGYNPLPILPFVALVTCFFYAYHITRWLKNR